jgi:hypothetical protein
MSDLVCSSDEFEILKTQHKEAWMRLRSVKAALVAVTHGLHAYQPQNLADEAYRSEPLEADRIGFPVDQNLVGAWIAAMAELENDADTDLPLFG